MFAPDHLQSAPHDQQHNTAVMTGNPSICGPDFGVRSVTGAGGYQARVAQSYHGGGMDASSGFNSYSSTASTVDSMKGFECTALDSGLLNSGGNNSSGGIDGQMYITPNRTMMTTNSTNMAYNEYGQNHSNAEGFGSQMTRSHAYNNQYMPSASYNRQTRGVHGINNTSVQQHSLNSDYSTDSMTRRMSVPAAENNAATQSYARANSYPTGTPYAENSLTQFPSTSQSYSIGGYSQTNFPELDSAVPANMAATAQMNRRQQVNSYQQSYASGTVKKQTYPTAAMGSGNEGWGDSSYPVQQKFPSHSSMAKTHSVESGESSSMYPQYQHGTQNTATMQGMQYTNARLPGYTSSNAEMTANHYSSATNITGMCTPTSTSMTTSNKFSKTFSGMSQQSRQNMSYSQMPVGHMRTVGYKNVADSQATAMGQSNVAGSSQRLRHYGPMPTQAQNAQNMLYRNYNHSENSVNSGNSAVAHNVHEQYQHYDQYGGATRHDRMRSLDGRFVSSASSAHTGVGMPTSLSMQNTNQRPFEPPTHQQTTTGTGHSSTGSANLSYYNNRTKPDAFSPTSMQTAVGCQESFNHTYPEGQQRFNSSVNNSNVMSHSNCPPAYQIQQNDPVQSEADIRRNMIFSAELEKLARLSRDPMADEFPGSVGTVGVTSQSQETVPNLGQTVRNPHYPSTASGNMGQTMYTNQGPNSSENGKTAVQGKSYQTQAATAPPVSVTTNHSAKLTNQQPTVQESCAVILSAPSTPSSTAGNTLQTSPDSNSTRPVRTLSQTNQNPSAPAPAPVPSQEKGKESQNAVQQLQRLTQSLKEKKDDGTKTSQHMEYLIHNNESSSSMGGQNCIAALSAACRNMIADMDNSVPKLTPTTHSPIAMKSYMDNPGSGMGQKYVSTPQNQTSYGTQITDQMYSPANANGQNISPPLVSMGESFGSPPYNTSNVPQDYQTQFSDFLEQSVPMQMNTRRPEEKPRKKGKRKKSDEVTDMTTASTIGPKKRRGRKKSSQNPLSVESLDHPNSLDNLNVSTPMSEGQMPLVEESPNRSATHTPNMMSNSWRTNDSKYTSSELMPGLLTSQQTPSVDSDSVTQDFLDSVFSPDTTMSVTNQEAVDSFSQLTSVNQSHHSPASSLTSQQSMNETASTGSYSSQGGLMARNNQCYQTDNIDQSKLATYSNQQMKSLKTSHGTVSSTGDSVSNPVSTSSDTTDANSEKSAHEEIHPLEILQAQIQLQRQQFNLNDSRPLPLKNALKKPPGVNPAKKTGPSTMVQGEVDVNVLMAEEDSTWYLPNEQPKEPEVPWENTRKNTKGQQPDINQFDRRTQNKLLEQKRRDSLKNSIDNLKNALPDGRNLTDQTQQSVLLKAQNYIKDMLGKQQRNKTCMEDIETLKSKNSTMEDSIAMLKQEYDILSNMECNLGPP
ncbi:uncharacterized protein [Asterias amurensis]|uniref:uncharacterized protein isoform X2 n=1 Tax=Asterias amurensis TaxID=7602 RepID=UPI003AB39434